MATIGSVVGGAVDAGIACGEKVVAGGVDAGIAGAKAGIACAEEVVATPETDLGDRACKLGAVGGATALGVAATGTSVTGVAAAGTATTYVGGAVFAIGAAGTAATVGAAAVGVAGLVVGARKVSHLNLGFHEKCPYPFRIYTPNGFEFPPLQYKEPNAKSRSADAVDICIGVQPGKMQPHTAGDSFAPGSTFCHEIELMCDNSSLLGGKGWNNPFHYKSFKEKVGSDSNYICARVGQWRNNVGVEGNLAGGDAKMWAKMVAQHIDPKSKKVQEFEFFVMMRAENINADHVWYLGSPQGRRVGNDKVGHLKIPSTDGSCHIEVHPVDTYASATIMGNFVSSNDAFSFTLKTTNLHE